MNDETINRLFRIYAIKRSFLDFPEDEILIKEGLITKEKEITKKGERLIEEMPISDKLNILDRRWNEPFMEHFPNLREAIKKMISTSSLEELPVLLAYKDLGVRKIAAETYEKLKEG